MLSPSRKNLPHITMNKNYINAQSLLNDSYELALMIAESGFQPDLIVGVWRGGTPVAIAIQEALEFIGMDSDHIAIRTTSYTGIGERAQVKVQGLDYLVQNLNKQSSLLIVDDVFDTGLSIDGVITELSALCKNNMPTIKVATPYFKPANNQTQRKPDYYLHEETEWLVFPHELLGLSDNEILKDKPGLGSMGQRLLSLRENKA